jgi:hypothetical protein
MSISSYPSATGLKTESGLPRFEGKLVADGRLGSFRQNRPYKPYFICIIMHWWADGANLALIVFRFLGLTCRPSSSRQIGEQRICVWTKRGVRTDQMQRAGKAFLPKRPQASRRAPAIAGNLDRSASPRSCADGSRPRGQDRLGLPRSAVRPPATRDPRQGLQF